MAEGSANKVKISDREKKVLFIIAGIIILALSYFLGFQKMMQSRSVYVEENIVLTEEVKKLRAMVADRARIEEETQKYLADKAEILAKYPPELRTQDVIYQLDLLEQDVEGLLLETESYTMNQIFFANGALTDGAVQDVAVTPAETAGGAVAVRITGYQSDVSTSCKTDYDSLKNIINFINSNPYQMVIDSITVAQGKGEKELTCNMGLKMYAVGGTGEEYQTPNVVSGDIGKKKLFETSKK